MWLCCLNYMKVENNLFSEIYNCCLRLSISIVISRRKGIFLEHGHLVFGRGVGEFNQKGYSLANTYIV